MYNKFISIVTIIATIKPILLFGGVSDSDYSVKYRWVVKASVSAYRVHDLDKPFVLLGQYESFINDRQMNYRIEGSYGLNKYLEVGISLGLQNYRWYTAGDIYYDEDDGSQYFFPQTHSGIAPVFGLNLNFQILPLFIKEPICRWDLYMFAKYGGCLLFHKEYEFVGYQDSKYRQEYGAGVGIAYYFKNRIGLFGELSVGNYSYFPRFVESNINFRFGITTKFNHTKL